MKSLQVHEPSRDFLLATLVNQHPYLLDAIGREADRRGDYLDPEEEDALINAQQNMVLPTPVAWYYSLLVTLPASMALSLVMLVALVFNVIGIAVGTLTSYPRITLAMFSVRMLPRGMARFCVYAMFPFLGSHWKARKIFGYQVWLAERLGYAQDWDGEQHLAVRFVRGVIGSAVLLLTLPLVVVDLFGSYVVEFGTQGFRRLLGELIILVTPSFAKPMVTWMRVPLGITDYEEYYDAELAAARHGLVCR